MEGLRLDKGRGKAGGGKGMDKVYRDKSYRAYRSL